MAQHLEIVALKEKIEAMAEENKHLNDQNDELVENNGHLAIDPWNPRSIEGYNRRWGEMRGGSPKEGSRHGSPSSTRPCQDAADRPASDHWTPQVTCLRRTATKSAEEDIDEGGALWAAKGPDSPMQVTTRAEGVYKYVNDQNDELMESNGHLAIENEELKRKLALTEERQQKYFELAILF
ncbi:hypothetical protein FCOIX_3681 [Fusarium coicis]|nr:hypothetical protein FCOIX_3681 [Fusarium coicis]